MAETPAGAPPEALVERIHRNDAADMELRQASSVIGALVRDLPATDDMLLTEASRRALRTLRDRQPELYLCYRAAIRQRAGRHIVDLLDHYVGPPAPGPWREIQLLTIGQLMAQPPTTWRIDRTLPDRGLGVIYGEPGSGKSFFAEEISCVIARGAPFFDRKTERARVLYLCAEGRSRDRVAAHLQYHGLTAEQFDLRFIEQSLDLCGQTADSERLEALVSEYAPAVVVVDTLARVLAGGDESSGQDMGRLLASFRRIEEACSGLVIVVHHSGKDLARGARGHSSLRAAADVEIEITRGDDGIRTARVSKLRDHEDGAEFCFRLEPVQLEDGRSSCVVLPAVQTPKQPRAERQLTPDEKLCLGALREQLQATGEALPASSTIPSGKRGVRVEAWRDRFYARIGEERESSARRVAFFRCKKNLIAKKLIGCWTEWVWEW